MIIELIEKRVEYRAPQIPKTIINQLITITGTETLPLNCLRKSNGGSTKAIIAAPIAPAMLRKSVKFGMSSEIPVTIQTIKDLTAILFSLGVFPV